MAAEYDEERDFLAPEPDIDPHKENTVSLGNRKIYRANLIENVGYCQTIINNRATFDKLKDKTILTPIQ